MYRGQEIKIKNKMQGLQNKWDQKIKVTSVDNFQGRSIKAYIIIAVAIWYILLN